MVVNFVCSKSSELRIRKKRKKKLVAFCKDNVKMTMLILDDPDGFVE